MTRLILERLAAALRRLTCRHAWRYSRRRSQAHPLGTALEHCPRCDAVRRMPRGPRFAMPARSLRHGR